MKKTAVHICCLAAWIMAALSVSGQAIPKISARTDRTQILIGEPIHLQLSADLPAGETPNWITLDSIPHFEWIDKGNLQQADSAGRLIMRQDMVITSFDSGSHYIPMFILDIGGKKYGTDSIRIEVSYSRSDEGQDYHDIKDIIPLVNPFARYVVWVVLVITLASIALAIYLMLRKKEIPEEAPPPAPRLPPYEEAMKALADLKKQMLPQNGQAKLYYTRLNDILRQFLSRKLELTTLEKTNEELIAALRRSSLSHQQFTQLSEALRMSDFVKFAKYLPGEEDNERNFKVIESSVSMLNEIAD